nr:polysaccharide deacetylase family protein [Motilibacter aurantiacus]
MAARAARSAKHRAYVGLTAAEHVVASARWRASPGCVALTFDDGPHPGSTDLVLDVLGELGVRATFFCTGANARAHPGLLRRIAAEGHAVGSHSRTHPTPNELGARVLADEYLGGHAEVEQALGAPVTLFRPPHGQLTPASSLLLRTRRMPPWLWTVDPRDWVPGTTAAHVAAVGSSARSGDVVLMHDWVEQPEAPEALDRSATIAALPAIVRSLRSAGLTLGRLPA